MKVFALMATALFIFVLLTSYLGFAALSVGVFGVSTMLLLQGGFATYSMLYTWLEKRNLDLVKPPRTLYGNHHRTFSIIIPARPEAVVIGSTLKAMARLAYPKDKYEVLVVVRSDDTDTITAVQNAIQQLKHTSMKASKSTAGTISNRRVISTVQTGMHWRNGQKNMRKRRLRQRVNAINIRLVIFDGFPINKPKGLNIGFRNAKNEIIAVFDAEDEPNPHILSMIDTVYSHYDVDVVQSAVQLINITTTWFSALNSLEYYFWFKSVLPYFSTMGSTPLGGNTVFFHRSVLTKIAGWDEEILTEDADIGLRLSVAGCKIRTVYDERLATLEESPKSLGVFIRQRSRWDQGFLQVLSKGDWMDLRDFRQQIITVYLLMQPILRHFALLGFLWIPFFMFGARVPLWLSMYSFLPMYFLLMQFVLLLAGLQDFGKRYQLHVPWYSYGILVLAYFPYQIVLSYASLRGILRLFSGYISWEKTEHVNAHRVGVGGMR